MPCSRGDLSLGVPSSFLAWGSSDQSPQRHTVHIGRLMEGRSGGLLSGDGGGGRGDAHSVWLRDLANIVVSMGLSRWCPAYVQSEQPLPNTTEMARQQCSVSFGWQPTNDLTSLPVDLWGRGHDVEWVLGVAGSRDAGTSGAGAVPLRSAQMMGPRKKLWLIKPVVRLHLSDDNRKRKERKKLEKESVVKTISGRLFKTQLGSATMTMRVFHRSVDRDQRRRPEICESEMLPHHHN